MADSKSTKNLPLKDTFSIVTGGSQGIGKSISKEIAKLGGNVCIIARRQEILEKAVDEIKKVVASNEQIVEMISCDVTDYDKLKSSIDKFIEKYGIPYYLINCVGQAYPKYIQDLTVEDFKKGVNINYFGVLIPILVMLPYFIENSEKQLKELGIKKWKKNHYGHIINLSSEAGFLGLMGYSTYCPPKFALVGLSECLRHELKPYHINVSVVYPVDTKTPGYDFENQTKPEELKMITAIAGLMDPDKVAEIVMKKVLKKKFNIFLGSAGFHYWIKRHLPGLAFSILDDELKKARKKIGKYTEY